MAKKTGPKIVIGGGIGVVIAALVLYFTLQGDKASFSIEKIEIEPFPLIGNQQARVAVTIKNSGKNLATIEAAAIDRADILPLDPIYEPTRIAAVQVPGGGGTMRLISDLGSTPWIPTQTEADSINKGHSPLRVIGFVEYSDRYWFFWNSVVGFCFAWDSKDAGGNFSVCPERKYTYANSLWPFQTVKVRDIPMVEIGPRTVSPTTVPMRVPDPRFPIQTIETR